MRALLALFIRSVREELRAKQTYWLRACFVALELFLIWITLLLTRWAGAPGLLLFNCVVWMNFFLITVAGLNRFSSAITEEKEEGTLGLLRMTNVSPLALLLGKSTGRLACALLLLAVQFPFTILATSLGGVSLRQVLAAYATLGAYLFFLANLALLFSVLCRRTSLASSFAMLGAVFFFLGPYWMALTRGIKPESIVLTYDTVATTTEKFLFRWSRASPFVRLKEILRTDFQDAPLGWQVWCDVGLGVLCFGLGWALFDLCADRAAEAAPPRGFGVRALRRVGGGKGRPMQRPLMWKDYHYVAGGGLATGIKFGICIGVVGMMGWTWWRHVHGRVDELGAFTMAVMALFWAGDLIICSSRIFSVEVRGQTLSSLASLPFSFGEMALQKVVGCLVATWPSILFFLVGLAMVLPHIWKERHIDDEIFVIIPAILAGIAFFLHLVVWLSLRVKSGALALAFLISTTAWAMIGLFCDLYRVDISDSAGATLVLVAFLIGIAGLRAAILGRLELLAAESQV